MLVLEVAELLTIANHSILPFMFDCTNVVLVERGPPMYLMVVPSSANPVVVVCRYDE
jgi:hypothetical protein